MLQILTQYQMFLKVLNVDRSVIYFSKNAVIKSYF